MKTTLICLLSIFIILSIFGGAAYLGKNSSKKIYNPRTIDPPMPDFIKILGVLVQKNNPSLEKAPDSIVLTISVNGYCADGWNLIEFYLDGKKIGSKKPDNFPADSRLVYEPNRSLSMQIIRIPYFPKIPLNKFNGKHRLRAVLTGSNGNTVEDTVIFDVE